jgi:prolyl-tRNA synthetase
VKFADADGIPYRVTVGLRGVADGMVEVTSRRDLSTEDVAMDGVVSWITEVIESQRHGG